MMTRQSKTIKPPQPPILCSIHWSYKPSYLYHVSHSKSFQNKQQVILLFWILWGSQVKKRAKIRKILLHVANQSLTGHLCSISCRRSRQRHTSDTQMHGQASANNSFKKMIVKNMPSGRCHKKETKLQLFFIRVC